MDAENLSAAQWAREAFGGSDLPDKRLAKRLISYASRQAATPEASTAKVCIGDDAAREGAYRLLENGRVAPSGIDEGPYQHCVKACAGKRRLLAIQDTTSVSVHHAPLAADLAESGSPTGFLAHSLIMVCADTGMPLGIGDQQRWVRSKDRARRSTRKDRAYEDKESVRWEKSLERLLKRLGEHEQLISVCDREADIYEFVAYHVAHKVDFVIRGSWNRKTADELRNLFEVARQAPVLAERPLQIEQRGAQPARNGQSKRKARKRRDAHTHIQATSVQIQAPNRASGKLEGPLEINVVRVSESNPPDEGEPLEWILLTSLPIESEDDVKRIVQYYERRWLIEEFFKSWKTGCRVESRPLQTLDAVERMLAITAPMGMRLLQIKCAAQLPDADDTPAPLDDDEWRCLWVSTCKQPLPTEKPSAAWAFRTIAKLGGFYDSKRTGRPGWQTVWSGWATLQERLVGWRAAMEARPG